MAHAGARVVAEADDRVFLQFSNTAAHNGSGRRPPLNIHQAVESKDLTAVRACIAASKRKKQDLNRRQGNIRNGDPSINSRRAGVFVLRPWNCMWVRNVMNEFLKIGPVSIGLLVDAQQLQSGITGACSFSLGVRI